MSGAPADPTTHLEAIMARALALKIDDFLKLFRGPPASFDPQYQRPVYTPPFDCCELSTDGEIPAGRLGFLPPLSLSADHNKRTYDLSSVVDYKVMCLKSRLRVYASKDLEDELERMLVLHLDGSSRADSE
jgi:hypothetical protein